MSQLNILKRFLEIKGFVCIPMSDGQYYISLEGKIINNLGEVG